MKKLFFETSISKLYAIMLSLIIMILIGCYSTYAYFTVQKEKQNVFSMVTLNLKGKLEIDGKEESNLDVEAGMSKLFTLKLSNVNERSARYNIYYRGNLPSGVEIGYIEEDGLSIPPKEEGKILKAKDTLGSEDVYKIKVKNTTNNHVTISLGYDVGLDYNDLMLKEENHLIEVLPKEETAVQTLLQEYTNDGSIQDYDVAYDKEDLSAKENKMYVFTHDAGSQQVGWNKEELTDYRYIGKDPNNYVTFNGELWRIIGIFTVEDENGIKEKRIKLIRENALDYRLSYDNKSSGIGSSIDVSGSNDWLDARLMMLLNPGYEESTMAIGGSLYWNQGKGNCPSAPDNGIVTCDFTNSGFKNETKNIIGKTKWYVGGASNYRDISNGLADHWYSYERGTETCTTMNKCSSLRESSWIGYVGLMYPSDYGYATSGGSIVSRKSCLEKELYAWTDDTVQDCKNHDWLFRDYHQWLLNPRSDGAVHSLFVNSNGGIDWGSYMPAYSFDVLPTVYLVSSVQLKDGNGTKNSPFVFAL